MSDNHTYKHAKHCPYTTPYDELIHAGAMTLREQPKMGAKKAVRYIASLSAPLTVYLATLTPSDLKEIAEMVRTEAQS